MKESGTLKKIDFSEFNFEDLQSLSLSSNSNRDSLFSIRNITLVFYFFSSSFSSSLSSFSLFSVLLRPSKFPSPLGKKPHLSFREKGDCLLLSLSSLSHDGLAADFETPSLLSSVTFLLTVYEAQTIHLFLFLLQTRGKFRFFFRSFLFDVFAFASGS